MQLIPLVPKTRRDGSLTTPIQEYAKVDDEDFDNLMHYRWYYKEDNIYSGGTPHISVGRDPVASDPNFGVTSLVIMSHHILKIHIKNFVVRYKDGDAKNCQKENLVVKNIDGCGLVELRQHWLDQIKPEIQLRMELPR
jgi:hypothetical protein